MSLLHYETHQRSVIKAISWRIWATITTMTIVFLFTGKLELAASVGVFDVISKLILYFIHERLWNKLRFGIKEIKPFVLWLTGVPYSEKTAIANKVYDSLKNNGLRIERLDSREIRTFFPQVGFSKDKVNNHIERVGHLAGTLERNGIVVIVSSVSPYRESRDFARKLCENFVEVYTASSEETCRKRYEERIKSGTIQKSKEFPKAVFGLYEKPAQPEITLDTEKTSLDDCRNAILNYVHKKGYVTLPKL